MVFQESTVYFTSNTSRETVTETLRYRYRLVLYFSMTLHFKLELI